MLQELLNHNKDLRKLAEEGYELEIRDGCGIVSHIPYLNTNGEVQLGQFVSTLNLQGDIAKYNGDHVIMFSGEYPCGLDNKPITAINHQSNLKETVANIEVNHKFSNKPESGYKDYHDKFTRYINIISGPAITKDPNQTTKTFRNALFEESDIFQYEDTNSTRAGISSISSKVKGQKIGIIGLGGTGSYVLDLLSKTHVKEIHIFDGDIIDNHNAFRMPSPPSKEVLKTNIKKTTYLKDVYSNMHKHIIEHSEFLSKENIALLKNLTFVFICIDNGESKKIIIDELVKFEIPFIDTGIGLNINNNMLNGQIRSSLFDKQNYKKIPIVIDFSKDTEDVYTSNIQISEINSMNATLSVMQWKKYNQLYADYNCNRFITYTIEMGGILYADEEINSCLCG